MRDRGLRDRPEDFPKIVTTSVRRAHLKTLELDDGTYKVAAAYSESSGATPVQPSGKR